MRVLVTGASGFVGQHVVRSLLSRGHSVIVLGRGQFRQVNGVEIVCSDLLAESDIFALLVETHPDVLVHLAWFTKHGEYWNSIQNLDWIRATARLVDAFQRAGGQRVVGVGTCAEYEWSDDRYVENFTCLKPHTLYGLAKDVTRRLLAGMCSQRKIEFLWARIFFLFGEGEAPQRLISSVIDVLEGKRAPFQIDGDAARDFLHVSDVAEGLVKLASHGPAGAYNLCSGQSARIADVVRHLAHVLGADADPLVRMFGRRSGEPRIIVGDSGRLRAIGWSPMLSLHDGLAKMVARPARC